MWYIYTVECYSATSGTLFFMLRRWSQAFFVTRLCCWLSAGPPGWWGMVAYNLPLGKRTPRGLCLLCLLPHPVSLLHPVFVQLHDEGHSFSFRTPWHQGGRQWELTQVQAHAGGFQLVLVFPDCLSTFPSELSALHADFRIHHQTYDSLAGDNLASFYNCLRGNFYL